MESDSDDSSTTCKEFVPPGSFSEEVHQILRSLYVRGMVGWGKKHSTNLNIAMARTGLNLSHIKVLNEFVLASTYMYYAFLCQNWIRRANMVKKLKLRIPMIRLFQQ